MAGGSELPELSKRDVVIKVRELLRQVVELERDGQTDAAQEALASVLKLDPNNAAALKILTRRAAHQRDRDGYALHASRLAEVDPEQTETVVTTLLRFGASGDAAKVAAKNRQYLSPDALERLRDGLVKTGSRLRKEPLVAARLLLLAVDAGAGDDVRDMARNMISIALKQGTVAAQEGRGEEARVAYEGVVEIDPTNVRALKALVNLSSAEGSFEAYARNATRLLAVDFDVGVAMKGIGKALQAQMPIEAGELFRVLVEHGRKLAENGDDSVLAYCRRISSRVIRTMARAKGADEERAAIRALEAASSIAQSEEEAASAREWMAVVNNRITATIRTAVRNKADAVLVELLPDVIQLPDIPGEELSRAALYLCTHDEPVVGRDILRQLDAQGRCSDEGLAMLGILAVNAGQLQKANDYSARMVASDGRIAQRFVALLNGARRTLG